MDEKRTERLIGMLRWLLENSACMDVVCGLENTTGPDVLEVLQRLDAQGYYEFILILLLRYHEEPAVIHALEQYLADRLGRSLRENGIQGELAVFKALLAQQLAREKTAKG